MASSKLDDLIEDSILITQDPPTLYLQKIDLERASVIIAFNDKESLQNIKFRNSRKIVIFAHSHLSSIALQIMELAENLAKREIETKNITELYLINTHLNENSHIEQLEWHPEWQGVWSSTPSDDQMDPSSSDSLKPSLGYFNAIANRLSNSLRNRIQIIVTHICLSSIWLTNDIFALNYDLDLFPDATGISGMHSVSESTHSTALNSRLHDFASVLSSFLDNNNIRDTLYAIGPSSNEIARSLVDQGQNSSRQSSSNTQTGAMILIDRTLDLGLPSMYSENPMDLVYDCFPRSKPHSIECLMDPKYFDLDDDTTEDYDSDSWLPILNWKNNPELNSLIQSLFCKSEREVLEALRNFISKFCYQNIRPIPDELEENLQSEPNLKKLEVAVKYIKSQPNIMYKHEELVVFLIAFLNAISHSLSIRQEILSSEKVIIAFFCQTREVSQIFYQLNDLLLKIAKEKKSGSITNINQSLSVRDVLLLTLHIYSIIGQTVVIDPQHEIYLQKGFVQAMMASNPKGNIRAVTMWVQKVFTQLSNVSLLRSTLTSAEFRNLMDLDSACPYTPLLFKITNHILNSPQNSLNPDIVHFPYRKTITKVLSGISILMGGSGSSHPSSFPTVILFVVGGITFQEVATLQAMYAVKGIRLIVGSNTICNRESLMRHIFKSK